MVFIVFGRLVVTIIYFVIISIAAWAWGELQGSDVA
jgi:hypothetical protein